MRFNKIGTYFFVVVAIILVIVFLIQRTTIRNLEQEKIYLEKKEKIKLEYIRDSFITVRNVLIQESMNELDSIINLKNKVHYVKIEKHLYIDRSLDDALDILADYEYKRTSKKDSTDIHTQKNIGVIQGSQ